jgi:hypothetical protein
MNLYLKSDKLPAPADQPGAPSSLREEHAKWTMETAKTMGLSVKTSCLNT